MTRYRDSGILCLDSRFYFLDSRFHGLDFIFYCFGFQAGGFQILKLIKSQIWAALHGVICYSMLLWGILPYAGLSLLQTWVLTDLGGGFYTYLKNKTEEHYEYSSNKFHIMIFPRFLSSLSS